MSWMFLDFLGYALYVFFVYLFLLFVFFFLMVEGVLLLHSLVNKEKFRPLLFFSKLKKTIWGK